MIIMPMTAIEARQARLQRRVADICLGACGGILIAAVVYVLARM